MGSKFIFFRKKKEKQQAEKEVLYSLKIYLNENYDRIADILEKVKALEEGALFDISGVEELLQKEDAWFEEEKNLLLDASYHTAILFAAMKRVRESSPFLKLTVKDDTKMLDLINSIMKDYTKYFKIHYTVQSSIAEHTYDEEGKRVLSYQEFCGKIRQEKALQHYGDLVECYLHIDQGNIKKVSMLLSDMEKLKEFLQQVVPEESESVYS